MPRCGEQSFLTVGFVKSTMWGCQQSFSDGFCEDKGISPILELGCFRLTLALAKVSKMSACPHWGKVVDIIIKRQIASLILFEHKVSE